MNIVAAGMHHAAPGRTKRQVARLGDRQAVHVGPNHDGAARPATLDIGHDAGAGDAGLQPVDRQRIKALPEVCGGVAFLERQFRHGVQLAAMGLQLLAGSGIDLEPAIAKLRGHPIILANWVRCHDL